MELLPHRVWRRRSAGMLAWVVLLSACLLAAGGAPGKETAVWARVELVENTAEGPAYDRCRVEGNLEKGQTGRWRFFYGEARADSSGGWAALRSSSGCTTAGSEPASTTWAVKGSPFFVVEVAAGQARVVGRQVRMEAAFTVQKLSGYAAGGAPSYETRNEKRVVWVPEGGSAVVPILTASGKEKDEFRVSELLLRIRASAPALRPAVEYGELAVSADVPRAEIFLDGGFVGRTSADGPVVLGTVRAGEREVVVRDLSGREVLSVARVGKGRRTAVLLTLMKGSAASANGLRSLGPNRQRAEELWRDKDGAIVVRIPGGEFKMGSVEGEGEPSERPQHLVRVKGFLMDKTEVTWGQYKRYLEASSKPAPKSPIWGTPEALPVSSITWGEARDFCEWVGGRLPSEAEWEHAARGNDARLYPWGNTFDPWRCNTRDGGLHAPSAAGGFEDCASADGVLDLAGGVLEWCSDWYSEGYYAGSPVEEPRGPENGTTRVVRGGHWMSSSFSVRGASRLGIDPSWPGPMLGFRCVQEDRKAEER